MRSLGTSSWLCVCVCAVAVAFKIEVRTGEDHDTTALSSDEGSHWWFYPGRPYELGGQFISPTGQFSPDPASPRGQRNSRQDTHRGLRTEDRGQARERCHPVPTRLHKS